MDSFDQSLRALDPSPKNTGSVLQVALRPSEGVHRLMNRLKLSPQEGVHGDRWSEGSWVSLPDGASDPRVQVSVTNGPIMAKIAGSLEAALACGDNLFVDFDLSVANLPIGSQLRVGTARLEVSDIINDGCGKFAERFGRDAFQWVRLPEHAPLRLRGLFCRIVEAGEVRPGDVIEKISPAAQPVSPRK